MADVERSVRRFEDGGIVPDATDTYVANKMVAIDQILASGVRDTVDDTTKGLIEQGRVDRDWAHVEAAETALDVLYAHPPTEDLNVFFTMEGHRYQSPSVQVGTDRYYLDGEVVSFLHSSTIHNASIGIRRQTGDAPSEKDPIAYRLGYQNGVAEHPGRVSFYVGNSEKPADPNDGFTTDRKRAARTIVNSISDSVIGELTTAQMHPVVNRPRMDIRRGNRRR